MIPILFNTEMVKAILEGRKTQTRRICEGQPQDGVTRPDRIGYVAPYQPGNVLWVRETWAALPVSPGGHLRIPDVYYYKAGPILPPEGWDVKWRPSIHMPKAAARIFLQVKDVRMERLRSITEQDAIAEGFEEDVLEEGKTNINFMCSVDCLQGSARGKFALLWNKTIRKDDIDKKGWKANPWVWVYEFEQCEKPY